jgi:hypothetical protein
MPLNSYQNNPIPTIVTYVTPTFDAEVLKNAKSKEDLNKHILSQTQGEPVVLTETLDLPSLMYITNVIYTTSPEFIFITKEGLKIQVYDFTAEPVIRPSDINISFSHLNRETIPTETKETLTVNISNLWEQQTASDLEQKIYDTVQEILKQLTKATKTTLLGNAPAILFLLSQHYLAGKVKELWYQEDQNSRPMRIY